MSITRIQNNQITDSTIVAYAKLQSGSLTGNLFAPTITLNSNVTINGNLFLSNTGNTTTINATNTYINDPLVVFNNGYTGSLSGYDIGMLVNRNLSALAPYGSAVNSAWVWVENDQAFESLITTDTGTGQTSINNSGYANVKTGNTTMVSGAVTGTLNVTGATTLTTANIGGLQAVAIGNVTAGTGAFTTLGASGIVTITNATQNTGAGSGALQVTGGAYIGGNLYVSGNINASVSGQSGVFLGNAGGQGALFAGISGGYLTEPMATFQTTANVNQYAGVINGQNINKGALASTDIFLSPDNGTYNDGYLDLGIASSTYNYPGFSLILPNDAYLFNWGNATTGGGNLVLGTGAVNDIVFATGGINQNNTVMRITSGNVVAIKSTNAATNTTSGALQVAGGVGVQGAIYAGSIQNTPVGSTTASTGNFTSLNAASGLTASTVSAATIGNAGAALSGSTTTLTGLLTASAVNAATIGNAGANAQFGFVTATTVNAATVGNASTAGQFGTVTATTVNAATIGNTGAAVTGSTATFGGLQAAAIGNVTPGSAVFTTVNTLGNIYANSATGSLILYGNSITSNTGKIGLGSISNVQITGGSSGYTIVTDGAGNLSFSSLLGNSILLGSNVSGQLVSNAVALTTTTDLTDAIAQLNAILGKLTPSSPPNFPATTLTQSTGTISGLMSNFAQTDNSGWGNLSVSGGTAVNVVRSAVFATSTVTNSGTTPSGGNIQLYINGVVPPSNFHALTSTPTSADNGTYGNLVVSGVQDYHNIVSTVAAGFWNVFSASIAATSIPAGWNRANIYYTGDAAATPTLTWYYDSSSPTAPAFSATSIALTSNTVTYSSTIPHLNSSAGFTLNGTVQNLSGDLYYAAWTSTSANFFSSLGAGGALLAPANRTLSQVGVPVPLTRNNTSAYSFSTTSNVTTGFGSASAATGPTLSVSTPYATSGSGQFAPGSIILYKTGTTTQIEETSLTTAYGTAARITNPDGGTAADNPAYTGTETTFNSATSTLLATDATVVAAKLQYDVTNYSTGYYPVGPNLSSGRSASQYFTFKFSQAALSTFHINYTGTLAGLWMACPGVTDTPASPTNGWLNAASAYGGAGVPGTGTGGNGTAGCAVGGNATLNSPGTYSIQVTLGSASTSSAGNKSNEIYVRVKLTSAQSLTALSIAA